MISVSYADLDDSAMRSRGLIWIGELLASVRVSIHSALPTPVPRTGQATPWRVTARLGTRRYCGWDLWGRRGRIAEILDQTTLLIPRR
jgi:hypothetical protein